MRVIYPLPVRVWFSESEGFSKMMLRILLDLIGDRDVEKMRVSEAMDLVAEFYMRVELLTLDRRGNSHADYYAEKALESCGLGFFAA